MEEPTDINPNGIDNLNPTIEKIVEPNNLNPEEEALKEEVTGVKKTYPALPTKEVLKTQKDKQIDEFNNLTEVKKAGIKAIDERTEMSISKKFYSFLLFLAIVGSIVIILSVGITGWTIYKDGSLKDLTQNICQPIINVSSASLSCPQATCNCNPTYNLSCAPPQINNYYNQSI